ncbi:MAG: hypothetical protein DSY76_07510 [Bacteroidetes bacterium]|nr:MAG: hypothetical protein DSY76_07510 [Bacteroidota bacterium]
MKVTFFKRGKPKQFNLKTRYYDPKKEEDELRKRRYERKKEEYQFNPDDMKNEMAYRWGMNRESNSSFNKRYTSLNRILLTALILAVVMAILYFAKTA